jgi:uncharacterized protein (TIGR02145 family)
MSNFYNATLASILPCIALLWLVIGSLSMQAQICDTTISPVGLSSTYTSGSGALLQWTPVTGSVGVQIEATLTDGPTIARLLVGPELDEYLLPDDLLFPGVYTWWVQAACGAAPPFSLTPISALDTFNVPRKSLCAPTITDIDGNVYDVVQIGGPIPTSPSIPSVERTLISLQGQCWMATNLLTERYLNGDSIATGLTEVEWSSTLSGAVAIYKDNIINRNRYGRLYNAFSVNDARGLCPLGWHIPSRQEWIEMIDFLGNPNTAGGPLKAMGTLGEGTGLWLEPNVGATNRSGFGGLPGGNRSPAGEDFFAGLLGNWWTSTVETKELAWYSSLTFGDNNAYLNVGPKRNGFSVRCVED